MLDLRAGVLRRRVHWRSPAGDEVRISSTRLVSLPQRGAAAILYEVEPVGEGSRIIVQSELVANEDGQPLASNDPRASAVMRDPLMAEEHAAHELAVMLVHSTRRSGLRMAAAMDHKIDGPPGCGIDVEAGEHVGRVTIAADVPAGSRLRVLKFLAYGWSGHRSLPSVRAQVRGSLAEARHSGWEGLCRLQREYLDDFWERADVEIEGDDELQQAMRFGLFHVLQAGARAEQRAIPAKGLTGSGYDGHAFWDTESFVLPVLTYTVPGAARDALLWRRATLDLARERAHQLDLQGAAFPWRTIAGRECSGYWPAGTAAVHIAADIADAVLRYERAVDDDAFSREAAVPLLVETARLWAALGHHDVDGRFRIEGVTGPDEYSALGDNNVYTNLMARRNLEAAADVVRRHPEEAHELGVDVAEVSRWRAARARDAPALRRASGHPSAVGRVHRPGALGLRGHERRPVPAAAQLPVLLAVPKAGGQAGRPRPRPLHLRLGLHRRAEGAQLRLLRGDHRARLVAVGVRAGDRRGRDRPPRSRLRLPRRGGADGPATTCTTTPTPGCTSPRSAAAGWPSRPASGASATTTATCASPRACPTASHAWPSV